jgi:hypothetical protein
MGSQGAGRPSQLPAAGLTPEPSSDPLRIPTAPSVTAGAAPLRDARGTSFPRCVLCATLRTAVSADRAISSSDGGPAITFPPSIGFPAEASVWRRIGGIKVGLCARAICVNSCARMPSVAGESIARSGWSMTVSPAATASAPASETTSRARSSRYTFTAAGSTPTSGCKKRRAVSGRGSGTGGESCVERRALREGEAAMAPSAARVLEGSILCGVAAGVFGGAL